ncbi:hypothetical protein QZH41_017736 [Actinostola sp. cb2023]|nr:hypothetical protein QZH41_017736 [Actinostola sp. cb2023]
MNHDDQNTPENAVFFKTSEMPARSLEAKNEEPESNGKLNDAENSKPSDHHTETSRDESSPSTLTGIVQGLLGCLRPVWRLIGKAHKYENGDDWVIPFEDIRELQWLGSGAQGAVFLGIYGTEQVAVKKVRYEKDTEIKHLRDLNHPNIVRFRGVCNQPPVYCIVMEYCQRGQLFEVLRDGREVTPRLLVHWATEIADGMHYLHGRKIIHRDLKSPNVLVSTNDTLKISDFGTCKEFNDKSARMTFAGTVAWMAPEVIRNEPCSEKVDIWSFGVLLWELLTGELPYKGVDSSAVIWGVGSNNLQLPVPSTCPEGIQLLMRLCWKSKPKHRPSFRQVLMHIEIAAADVLNTAPECFLHQQITWRSEISVEFEKMRNESANLQNLHHLQRLDEELIQRRKEELNHYDDDDNGSRRQSDGHDDDDDDMVAVAVDNSDDDESMMTCKGYQNALRRKTRTSQQSLPRLEHVYGAARIERERTHQVKYACLREHQLKVYTGKPTKNVLKPELRARATVVEKMLSHQRISKVETSSCPNSSSSSSSHPKDLALNSHQLELTLQDEASRSRSSLKKSRGYYKSKRLRRRPGSQSSADRSPATKRSPMSPCGSNRCFNDHHISSENGMDDTLPNDDHRDSTFMSSHNDAISPPRVIPGSGGSMACVGEQKANRNAPNSSDSGPHPASSCESDTEVKNHSVANAWNVNLRTYNNNKNLSKRTRNQNEHRSTDSSEGDSAEISDIEADLSCNGRYEALELLEEDDDHIRRIVEHKGRSSLERYEVS